MSSKYIKYSEEEAKWLADNHLLRINEYQKRFNDLFKRDVTKHNLCSYRRRKGFRTGRTGQYGNDRDHDGNRGVRMINAGSFKKGCEPFKVDETGTERKNKTGGYVRVKDKNGKWVSKQIYVWELHNGKIPKGHAVTFKDGNRENFDIDNLELLTRVELLRINQLTPLIVDESLREPIRTLGKLQAAINLKNS